MDLKLLPRTDRVLVKPLELKNQTSLGGIIVLPDTVELGKPRFGRVLEVGEGRWEDGKCEPLKTAAGTVIVFSKHAGMELSLYGATLVILREDEILCEIGNWPADATNDPEA